MHTVGIPRVPTSSGEGGFKVPGLACDSAIDATNETSAMYRNLSQWIEPHVPQPSNIVVDCRNILIALKSPEKVLQQNALSSDARKSNYLPTRNHPAVTAIERANQLVSFGHHLRRVKLDPYVDRRLLLSRVLVIAQ